MTRQERAKPSARPTASTKLSTEELPSGREEGDIQLLFDLSRYALRQGGFMQGNRLGELMIRRHRGSVDQAKIKFGAKGWLKNLLLSEADFKFTSIIEHGGPCFYLDPDG